MVKLVPHNRPTFGPLERDALAAVAESGYWASGPRVAELEQRLSEIAEVPHAVCVASGTAALELALAALGVGEGDDVLIPAYSCVALPNAVLNRRATPIAVDVVAGRWNIDPDAARRARTTRTRAIIAVHTFGLPAEISELRALGIPVVEDCSHAFGIRVSEKPLGALGDVAILSLYAMKLIGAGEGGVVLARDARVGDYVREWRDYRDRPLAAERRSYMMTDLAAALAICQLQRLPRMLAARDSLAKSYDLALRPVAAAGAIRLPRYDEIERVWYRYTIELRDRDAAAIRSALLSERVCAELPVDDWHRQGKCPPIAAGAYQKLLSLPLFPTLTDREQSQVCTALALIFAQEPMHA